MQSYLHEIIDNFEQYRIGIDDVFSFKCRACGKCCKQREDILLNPRDVYNLATALSLTHEQVIEKYCDTYIGQESRIPIVRLMPKGSNRVCPLLEGNRCSVHRLKPSVYALAPIGRVAASEDAPEDMGLGSPDEISYIFTNPPCGSLKRKQTVRGWLEMFGIPIEDRFFIAWNKTAFAIIETIQKYEGKDGVTKKAMEMLWDGIYALLYIAYDTQKDFMPQFEENVSKLQGIFETLAQFKFSE